MDMGDKATNKAMAIAYKYLCFQIFCIPTEEMSDPDAESLETELKAERRAESPASKICAESTCTADTASKRRKCARRCDNYSGNAEYD